MTQRIRRYGKFAECPSCHYEHWSSSERWREDGQHRPLRIEVTKTCSPGTCKDNAYRHRHRFCEKCGAEWLDCWKEDKVPWWSVLWYRATHRAEQMDRESQELDSD